MSTQGQPDAVRSHRAALRVARKEITRWAGKNEKRRVVLLILADCGSDRNGDITLDALAAVFEEYTLPDHIVRALDALASAAHRLGRVGLLTALAVQHSGARTQFGVGELVRARDSVQGLVGGTEYRVDDVDVQRLVFGTFVTYFVRPVARPTDDEVPIRVGNGHLLLEQVTDSAVTRDKELRSYYLGEDE